MKTVTYIALFCSGLALGAMIVSIPTILNTHELRDEVVLRLKDSEARIRQDLRTLDSQYANQRSQLRQLEEELLLRITGDHECPPCPPLPDFQDDFNRLQAYLEFHHANRCAP